MDSIFAIIALAVVAGLSALYLWIGFRADREGTSVHQEARRLLRRLLDGVSIH